VVPPKQSGGSVGPEDQGEQGFPVRCKVESVAIETMNPSAQILGNRLENSAGTDEATLLWAMDVRSGAGGDSTELRELGDGGMGQIIAMENGPFLDGLPIKNGDFPWLC